MSESNVPMRMMKEVLERAAPFLSLGNYADNPLSDVEYSASDAFKRRDLEHMVIVNGLEPDNELPWVLEWEWEIGNWGVTRRTCKRFATESEAVAHKLTVADAFEVLGVDQDYEFRLCRYGTSDVDPQQHIKPARSIAMGTFPALFEKLSEVARTALVRRLGTTQAVTWLNFEHSLAFAEPPRALIENGHAEEVNRYILTGEKGTEMTKPRTYVMRRLHTTMRDEGD